jgi:hypothetical protein
MGLRSTQGYEKRLGPATTPYRTATLSLSSRPKRTRISCHAAPDKTACAPFFKERRMMFANATNFYRKSGAAQWRDLCVDAPSWKCFRPERSVVERSAVFTGPGLYRLRMAKALSMIAIEIHPCRASAGAS